IMSVWIVDPRHIDYLVQWAHRRRSTIDRVRVEMSKVPEEMRYAHDGLYLRVQELTSTDLGRILMAENIRSVRYRYPEDSADMLPGPVDQSGIWRYTFRPIANDLDPAWVVQACRCLQYQSCATPDYRESLAYQLTQAIYHD